MPDHRIRLRGPWDRIPPGGPDAPPPGSVTLPCPASGLGPGPFRLLRRFGRPPFDPALESLRLDLADVPGLVGVSLNGVELPLDPGNGAARSIPIDGPMPARNVLALDVDLAGLEAPAGPWGTISLAIGPRADPGEGGGGPGIMPGRGAGTGG